MEGFVRYQQARALSDRTIQRRNVAIRSLQRFLGDKPIFDATNVDIEDWMATLRAPATKAHFRSDVNVLFRWAMRRGYVDRNPVELTDTVRQPRSLPRPLRGDVILTAISVANSTTGLAIMLGAFAGLRISEICSLHTDDLNLSELPLLTVRGGKGGKDRVVPLHPLLATLLARRSVGWVFPAPSGNHLGQDAMRNRIESAFAAIGVRMVPHQLRSSFATELARLVNGNLLLVAHVLGHDSVVTTSGYTKFAMGPEIAAICRVWAEDEPARSDAAYDASHGRGTEVPRV